MPILKYILFGIIFIIAALIDSTLRYITPPFIDSFYNYPFFQKILEFLTANEILTAAIVRVILVAQVMLGIVLYPYSYISKKKKQILKRVYSNLFNENIKDHRVTLFKEVNYLYAIWRYICTLCFHFFRPWYFAKFLLHFQSFPSPGYYLIVDSRYWRFKKSRTMFRVEESVDNDREGIVGLIRFQKGICALVENLPDITKIDLNNPNENEAKLVAAYMNEGCIKDINMLKRLHVRARHFLGSVIYKTNGEPWGMLLVDSVASVSPFNQAVADKFKVYSETLTDLFS